MAAARWPEAATDVPAGRKRARPVGGKPRRPLTVTTHDLRIPSTRIGDWLLYELGPTVRPLLPD